MDFFDDIKNVSEYIKMVENYTGSEFIKSLDRYLSAGSEVLELGMGPGADMDILSGRYHMTGSDRSEVFLNLYRDRHPEASLLHLDAITLETDQKFDALFSNKVLIHLSKAELIQSFTRQKSLLRNNGLLLHSFWLGSREEEFQGLKFHYYQEKDILSFLPSGFEVLETGRYTEMDEDDSFYLLLRYREDASISSSSR